jgi:hypothetical protein
MVNLERERKLQATRQADILERLSRYITEVAFGIAFVAVVSAPLLALSWNRVPFPGFMIEQTLVVNGDDGAGWSGNLAGIRYPQRIDRIAGIVVATPGQFREVLAEHSVGETISVFTRSPDGSGHLYPSVALIAFPVPDMLRLFWLPYLVGVAYLAIGTWVYLVGGRARPGRALAFFCVCASAATVLLFDLSTTHAGSAIWTLSVAQIGGALASLALRFPEEWKAVERRPWILVIPYAVSITIAVWGLFVLNDGQNPWAYVGAWGASYRLIALGIAVFLGVMFYRARASQSAIVRRQARIVLLGSAVAFLPIGLWLAVPLFGMTFPFVGELFLPTLVIFPVVVGIAILRYRLWEIDVIVNRAVVYGALTAILAGIFTASIGLSQKLFVAMTGEQSDAALVVTTLILVAAFTPIKNWLQAFVDRQFREPADETLPLRQFGDQVQSFIQLSDPRQLTHRLITEAARSLHAESAAVSLMVDGELRPVHAYGPWKGQAWASVPLDLDGRRFGLMFLGPRPDRGQYTRREYQILQGVAQQVARAISLAKSGNGSS